MDIFDNIKNYLIILVIQFIYIDLKQLFNLRMITKAIHTSNNTTQ